MQNKTSMDSWIQSIQYKEKDISYIINFYLIYCERVMSFDAM